MALVDRFVVVEGPDDSDALRALLGAGHLGEASKCPPRSQAPRGCFEVEIEGRIRLGVEVSGGGKSALALRAIDLAIGFASRRPDTIIVCFDPDRDAPPVEWKFFERDWKRVGLASRRAGPLERDEHSCRSKIGGRDVRIVSAPWRSEVDSTFDGLADDHCLERVLITGLIESGLEPSVVRWAEDATRELMKLVGDHGWKRAFRVWNAALHPDVESLVARLLQDSHTKRSCEEALLRTSAWKAIAESIRA